METLEMIGYFVAVVAGFKALEWVIEKITKSHDKSQKIDENAMCIEEFKNKTDKMLEDMQRQINDGHKYSTVALNDLKKEITDILENHREEYLKGIDDVKHSVLEMSSVYQQTVAIIELKIDNLEKKQDKYNHLQERMAQAQLDIAVLDNRTKVSENRIKDLENNEKYEKVR